ncbi:MAG: hypothetical protein R3C03_24090 [Pirellulaceae bacterium]
MMIGNGITDRAKRNQLQGLPDASFIQPGRLARVVAEIVVARFLFNLVSIRNPKLKGSATSRGDDDREAGRRYQGLGRPDGVSCSPIRSIAGRDYRRNAPRLCGKTQDAYILRGGLRRYPYSAATQETLLREV